MKKYVIFAGVNGAGKSTLYQISDNIKGMKRINSDEIVRSFGDWNNADDVIKAGRIAVKTISECFSNGISFNQETTLCGKTIIRNINKAKELGYYVEMHYVGIDSAETAKKRIAYRVAHGGHGIPDKDVERRYTESLENLKSVIKMTDLAVLYDNTVRFRRFAIFIDGEQNYISDHIPVWYKEILDE